MMRRSSDANAPLSRVHIGTDAAPHTFELFELSSVGKLGSPMPIVLLRGGRGDESSSAPGTLIAPVPSPSLRSTSAPSDLLVAIGIGLTTLRLRLPPSRLWTAQ